MKQCNFFFLMYIFKQTQDKNTVISKSIENAYQKSGILSNAARKVERSGNLKITFSDPISNLLKPNKARASITRAGEFKNFLFKICDNRI